MGDDAGNAYTENAFTTQNNILHGMD